MEVLLKDVIQWKINSAEKTEKKKNVTQYWLQS